jgi:hypothetical protein
LFYGSIGTVADGHAKKGDRARKGKKGSATVLDRKDKVGVFQELVGEDDELSHEGSESEFFGFAASEETEVERSEDRIERSPGSHLNILTFESELDKAAGWLGLSGWNLRGDLSHHRAWQSAGARGKKGSSLTISANVLDSMPRPAQS